MSITSNLTRPIISDLVKPLIFTSESFIDPLLIPDIEYLYDMEDSTIAESAGGVDSVSDLSGNGNTLTLGGANKATLVAGAANGNAVLRNVGAASSFYDTPGYLSPAVMTYVIACRINNDNEGIFGGFSGGNCRFQTNADNQAAYDREASGANAVFAVPDTGDMNIYAFRARSAADADIMLNGAVTNTIDPDNQYIGRVNRLFHADNVDADIPFVAAYSRALSDSEIVALNSYLMERFV